MASAVRTADSCERRGGARVTWTCAQVVLRPAPGCEDGGVGGTGGCCDLVLHTYLPGAGGTQHVVSRYFGPLADPAHGELLLRSAAYFGLIGAGELNSACDEDTARRAPGRRRASAQAAGAMRASRT